MHIETAQIEGSEGQIVEQSLSRHRMSFDRDGRLIEQIFGNPDGGEWRIINDYSDCAELLASRSFDASGQMSSETIYIYDDERRLIAEQATTIEGNVSTPTTYSYDHQGRRTKTVEFDFSPGMSFGIEIEGSPGGFVTVRDAKRLETRYDERDNAIEIRVFNIDGALVSRVEIVRDALGNPLEETQLFGDVIPVGKCASGSCSTGEILTEDQIKLSTEIAELFPPGTPMSTRSYRYDADGRLVESRLTMLGIKGRRQTYAYDAAGQKTEEVSYNPDETVQYRILFTRDYDQHGNWTTELVSTATNPHNESSDSTSVQITRRVIAYW